MENYHPEPFYIDHIVEGDYFADFQFDNIPVERISIEKGCQVRNVVNHIIQDLMNNKPVILTSEGEFICEAVKISEILKTKLPILFQLTKAGQMRTEETWAPYDENLDLLKITRSSPIIYILLSISPLTKYDIDSNELGYQKNKKSRNHKISTLSLSQLT